MFRGLVLLFLICVFNFFTKWPLQTTKNLVRFTVVVDKYCTNYMKFPRQAS